MDSCHPEETQPLNQPSQEELVSRFLEASNDLLQSSNLVETFLYQWMELLEESFDFAPLYFYLPMLLGSKVYGSNSLLEKKMERHLNQLFAPGAVVEDCRIYPFDKDKPTAFYALDSSLHHHPLTQAFHQWFPFYFAMAHKVDTLATRLQLARFQLAIHDFLQENPTQVEESLELLISHTSNEYAFVYHIPEERIMAPSQHSLTFDHLKRPLMDILLQTVYQRSFYTNSTYREGISSLVLYPVFSDDDMVAIVGSFSLKNAANVNSDLPFLCEFCSHGPLMAWLMELMNRKDVLLTGGLRF